MTPQLYTWHAAALDWMDGNDTQQIAKIYGLRESTVYNELRRIIPLVAGLRAFKKIHEVNRK